MTRTYDWGHNKNLPMSRPDLTDVQAAGEVRMLGRSQLNHEMICTMARDRIMALVKEKAELEKELKIQYDKLTSMDAERVKANERAAGFRDSNITLKQDLTLVLAMLDNTDLPMAQALRKKWDLSK